ncbi:Fe/S biogenesis protein NfuA [Mycobacterium lentiflavum]|uniref:Fe/S biogenesis protein NfuA n=1 Tax=Mycobacterium lentiflavum TaxID=141349 RepID=A0A0E4CMJ3_MYCLN|nr:NifU family protein [Mycobacterium lentiflavum]CQD10545.1 Fe/S biogenesis protein NfuA [Mycobacterium lentiflavum]
MIPLHATATEDPRQLRWVVAAEQLPARGTVRVAPGRLGALLHARVIDEIVVSGAGILITLGAAGTWRELGDDIREALSGALQDPAGWTVDETPVTAGALTAAVTELLAGAVGALAASHGGSIELVSVVDHHVTVRMAGACDGCPGASATLRDALERELRRRVDDQVVVSSENDSASMSFGKKLLSLIVR